MHWQVTRVATKEEAQGWAAALLTNMSVIPGDEKGAVIICGDADGYMIFLGNPIYPAGLEEAVMKGWALSEAPL